MEKDTLHASLGENPHSNAVFSLKEIVSPFCSIKNSSNNTVINMKINRAKTINIVINFNLSNWKLGVLYIL